VFPAALAKIGVMVVWKEPTEGHAKSLTFKASISPLEAASENTEEETTLIEFGFDMAEVKKNMPIEQGANLNLQITPTFVLSPVVIAAPSKIRITVLRDGERWAIGRLNIPVAPAAEEVVQTPSKTEPT
jgi:hypothetical protein